MQQFGELALLIGDLHIPQRAVGIPAGFKELLVPGKMQHVLVTGNVGDRETLDWIRSLSSNVHIVRGEFDDPSLPESKVVTVGSWSIGIIHGHQVIPWGDTESLACVARQLNCDILLSGHIHENQVNQSNGKYFINPGSATGAYSPLKVDPVPSFTLLAAQGNEATLYVYELTEGNVEVNKITISKQA